MTRGCDLKSWKVTEDDGETIIDGQSHTYTYGDANWKDLLTAFDGHAITYDNAGNPTTYYDGSTMVWGEGRRLQSITKNGQTTSYQYDASGNRIRVTYPDGSYTKYCVLDGRVIGEIVYKSTSSGVQWSHGVRYIYGDDGSVVGFGIWDADTTDEWERYYFVKNLQGDVLKVYRDADNALVASYEYDPFGNILSATGEMADENPFRYRGYHYDTNTGFYYLQSRYYDPLTCRFINADSYASTGQGVLGYNMFAYCGNNPISRVDPAGWFWNEFFDFFETAFEEISNAISEMAPVYSGCSEAANIDGPLFLGDIIGGVVAIAATAGAVAYGVYQAVRTLPTSTSKLKTSSIAIERTAYLPPDMHYNYWTAEIVDGMVTPMVPLTYSEAQLWVAEGNNLLCRNYAAAFAIVKFYPSARWDSAHGCKDAGYLDHFHLSSAHDNHIWYYGG